VVHQDLIKTKCGWLVVEAVFLTGELVHVGIVTFFKFLQLHIGTYYSIVGFKGQLVHACSYLIDSYD